MSDKRGYTVLAKATHGCNMSCKYCYDRPNRDRVGDDIMTEETLDAIASRLDPYCDITFTWHGGESTIIPASFFYRAQEIFGKYPNIYVHQSMQSNGKNVSNEFIKMLVDCHIGLGLSFDLNTQGDRLGDPDKGVASTLDRCHKHGLRAGCITVITEHNTHLQTDMYKQIRDKWHYRPAFNHVFGSEGVTAHNLEIKLDIYRKSYGEFATYVIHDISANAVMERTLITTIEALLGRLPTLCTYSQCIGKFMAINPLGWIYPCDRVYPDHYLGASVWDLEHLSDYFETPSLKLFGMVDDERTRRFCKSCEWLSLCNGGCPSTHMTDSGDDPTKRSEHYCELMAILNGETYKILQNVDPYNDPVNPQLLKEVLNWHFYFPQEIKVFLQESGITIPEEPLIPVTSQKLFRITAHINRCHSGSFLTDAITETLQDVHVLTVFDWISLRSQRKREVMQRVTDNREWITGVLEHAIDV